MKESPDTDGFARGEPVERDPGLGERAAEWLMALLAFATVPALLLEDRATTPAIQSAASLANWIIWAAFCGEFAVRFAQAPRRAAFVRSAWLDLGIAIVSAPFLPEILQASRTLRLLRAVRLLRAMAFFAVGLRFSRRALVHRHFHYVAVVGLATVGLGALGVFTVERGLNPAIDSFGDALWWAIVTTTTVGYGDVSPVTTAGRLIATGLMFTGIGVIGVFTATIASFFFEQDTGSELGRIERRLERLEEKVDQLLRWVEPRR